MSTVLLKDYAYTTCHIQKMVLYTQTYIRRYGVAYAYHVFEICSLQCCLIECHSFIQSIRGFDNEKCYKIDEMTMRCIWWIQTFVNILDALPCKLIVNHREINNYLYRRSSLLGVC